MAAPKGNRFWELRSSHGSKPIFPTADALWAACCEYFKFIEDNPLQEQVAFGYKGGVTKTDMPKMRAMTIQGLCLFLDISEQTWYDYKDRDGFLEVTTRVGNVIRTQKFEGAAAGLLNPNIIARDLALRDGVDHTSSDGSMSPKAVDAGIVSALVSKLTD